PRACPIRVLWKCPSSGKSGSRDCIRPCRRKARSFPVENGSAASSQSDRHRTRCSSRRRSTPFDPLPFGGRNKIRAALHSACKTADKGGTRCGRPGASSTSIRGNQTASAPRPLLPTIAHEVKACTPHRRLKKEEQKINEENKGRVNSAIHSSTA